MSKILELYKAQQSALGVDKISFEAGQAANTPYSIDDTKNADEQVLTAAKFKTGRGGDLKSAKYSDSVKK
jgi:hypothetical protein